MDQGVISDNGTYDHLLESNNRFKKLANVKK